jgi:puromycin-sensitive aminopeptidase
VDPYRLPRTVVPRLYDLRLEPDLDQARFTGSVAIEATVHEPTSLVVLNAIEMQIEKVTIEAAGRVWQPAVTLEESTERCLLTLDSPLPAGPARLVLHFTGTLNDQLRGFYRSRFKAADGTLHTLAATQFEATDARRAFPCWDEPAFKAVFRTTLVLDPSLQAVSNTLILEEKEEAGRKILRFADTIPMSSYLVAFIIGELVASEPVMVGSTPLRVWSVAGKQHLTAFARDIAAFSLGYFEDYYGRPYPGDKLDLIAIPDFAAGAMENLGAITFRETALLVDSAAASHQERERVADVVAHENAHMWFGDLVTMNWWNGLWLNEAFATFMEMKAVDAWKPEWQRWTTFGVSRSAAFTVDGLQSTRPIEYPVQAPRDADAMFDVLTYEKGASVLRMLEQYLGPEVFREGVRIYLARHAFGNTETADLWKALEAACHLPIPSILDGWIFHPGYPLLSVRREGTDLVLAQQRFSYLPPEPGSSPSDQVWQVPVQIRLETAGGSRVERVLLRDRETRLPLPGEVSAVFVNEGGHGFYRVRYSPELLTPLLEHLGNLAAIERFNLVNDTWAGVLAGLVGLREYLDLTSRFGSEPDRNVWSALLGSFHAVNRIVEDADRPRLARLVRQRVGGLVAELGWTPRAGEDELTGQLRADLLRAAGTLGDDAQVQAEAAEVYQRGQADAGVLAAAIAILAHTGGPARYEEFLAAYRVARTPQEEQRYLHALAGFREQTLVERTLGLTIDGTVRTQDAPLLLRSLFLGVHSRAATWRFVRANRDTLEKGLPPVGFRRLWEGLIGLATRQWEAEVKEYLSAKPLALGGRVLEQYLEQLHIAVCLREREGEALRGYLP